MRRNRMIIGRKRKTSTGRFLLGIIFGAMIISWLIFAWLSSPGNPAPSLFIVSPGESAAQITSRLKTDGFIRSKLIFKSALRSSGLASNLQPGAYDFHDVSSYSDIIERLASGGIAASELTLRLIEGWNLNDISKALEQADYPAWEELFLTTGQPRVGYLIYSHIWPDFGSDYRFLEDKPEGLSLEGYLFPDTYRIFRDATPEELVRRLLDNFQDRIEENNLHREITESGRSFHEIITMASILEKEIRGEKDRQMVSDIFWRRFEVGMALQADSTVNYVTGKSVVAVSAEDLESDSRYNTYKYPGLPPGPICNPGLSAIRAAIWPEANNYWYFLTDKDGNVHYARDFEEHKRNKARYLY